jgi:hypothetical protein
MVCFRPEFFAGIVLTVIDLSVGLQFLESGQEGERLTFDRLQRIAAHFEERQLRHLLEQAGFDVGDMIVAQVPAHTI